MNFFMLIGYIIIFAIIFEVLEKKYKLRARYVYYKGFKNAVNLGALCSFMLIILTGVLTNETSLTSGFKFLIVRSVVIIPLFLYSCIKIEDQNEKAKRKKMCSKDEEVHFCYYCGSDLDAHNICLGCGRQIDKD